MAAPRFVLLINWGEPAVEFVYIYIQSIAVAFEIYMMLHIIRKNNAFMVHVLIRTAKITTHDTWH